MSALATRPEILPERSRLVAAGLYTEEVFEGAAYGFTAQTLTHRVIEKWRQAIVDLADQCETPALFLYHDFSAVGTFVPDYCSVGVSQVSRCRRPQTVYSALVLPRLSAPARQIFDFSDLAHSCHIHHLHTEVFHQPGAALKWLGTQIGAQHRNA